MSKQIDEVTKSIKSKLSFENYSPSKQNNAKTTKHNDIKTVNRKKVKRTFYILEEIADALDEFYARKLIEKNKVDKSDIVSQAIKNLLEDKHAHVEVF